MLSLHRRNFWNCLNFLNSFDAEKAAIEEAGGNLSGYTIAVLDGIEDPHNVGAIVRSAEASGVKAILLPQRRSAGLTQTVARVSAGALAHMRVVRIINIVSTLEKLKERGLWIAGLSLEGATDLHQTDLVRPLALVIGSEGTGISRLGSRALRHASQDTHAWLCAITQCLCRRRHCLLRSCQTKRSNREAKRSRPAKLVGHSLMKELLPWPLEAVAMQPSFTKVILSSCTSIGAYIGLLLT